MMENKSHTVRAQLWQLIRDGVFEVQALDSLSRWVVAHREALLDSPDPPEAPRPGWVGGSPDPEIAGARCFLKQWYAGEWIGRHTHPNGMLVVVLAGSLDVAEGWDAAHEEQFTLGCGDALIRVSAEDGFDHFPHTLGTHEETVSLHLYSAHGSRGRCVLDPGKTE